MNNLTPETIENQINLYMELHSGFEPRRDYLSISHISGCPRRTILEYRNGFEVNEHTHPMCFAGYEMERSVLQAMGEMVVLTTIEVIAPFDNRLKGHLDAATTEGEVVEIKSVNRRKWEKMLREGRPLFEHFVQVQLYMRYLMVERGFVIYRNRETYEHKVLQVDYDDRRARNFEEKARRLLQYIDDDIIPDCECGRCKS